MNPEIKLVAKTQVDWPELRRSVLHSIGVQPSSVIAQCPVTMSQNAETVLFPAYMLTDNYERDAHSMLIEIPFEAMHFMSYTLLVRAEEDVIQDLKEKTTLNLVAVDDTALVTGDLMAWYGAIVLNLTHPNMCWKPLTNTRLLFDKLYLFFESEGFSAIFNSYNKKMMSDGTFLLEQ